MLTHFIYCRKSEEDDEKQIISNESQRDELHPIVSRDNLRIAGQIEEEASAKTSGTRKNFNDMLRRIKRGEGNAILCWHLNRLSRNAGDAAALVELMDQNKLMEIRTPSQTFKNIPADKFLIILFCGQAKLENDNKGIDVERGLRKKASMGWYPGVAPMGYLNDKTKLRGERDLYKDADRFPLIKQMWQMMLTGTYTPPQIAKIANEQWGFRTRRTKRQGDSPLSVSALYHIFHNPFYYGWFEYPRRSGNWYEGKHEPMITKAEFDRVQAILWRKGNPRASKHTAFPYTGIIRCGACSGMVTAEEKHNLRCTNCRLKFVYHKHDKCPRCGTPIAKMTKPVFRDYTYYHCARRKGGCTQPGIEAAKLEEQIVAQLRRIEISGTFKDWSFSFLKEIHREDATSDYHIKQSYEKAYANCLKRLENLIRFKMSPANMDGSLLSDEEYAMQRRELLGEKAALENLPRNDRASAEQALRQAQEVFEFAESACEKFAKGDFRTKKQILTTMGSHQTLHDKRLLMEAKKPFVWLGDFLATERGEIAPVAPENAVVIQRRKSPLEYQYLTLLRDLKDVRTRADKIKLLISKVYHHFKELAAFEPNANN
ncbi:MAG TPA: recombinase family protein [Verrucomicrobiae bacterium]|nr:recombinase family protein [Verrucomicrobiae bacterium]